MTIENLMLVLATPWNVSTTTHHNKTGDNVELSVFKIDRHKTIDQEGFVLKHKLDGLWFDSAETARNYAYRAGLMKQYQPYPRKG